MSNEIQKFYHNEFGELEVLTIEDKYYFPASKCASILGYSNVRDAIKRHCKGVVFHDSLTTGGMQSTNYIPEGDVYRLIIRSKLPGAQRFEAWVFDEVLPSIRKHGAYIMPELLEKLQKNTEENARLIATLAAEQRERIALQEKNQALEATAYQLRSALQEATPKASYCDMIFQNPDAVPVTLIAKDYGYSARAFNAMLHEYGIQYCVGGTWCLYQEYSDFGYTHGNMHMTKNGNPKMHTCWTQKGRLFLYDFLKGQGIVPKIERVS